MSKESRILIKLGLVLDTDISRAIGSFCTQLNIPPAQAVSILKKEETRTLIDAYKKGDKSTDEFFASLKSIIVAEGINIAELEARDVNWAKNAWNAQTKVDPARIAQLHALAEESELYIFSDTNPAHMEAIGGVKALAEQLGIEGSRIFLSYQAKRLDIFKDAFAACFAEQNPDMPVILVLGAAPSPHQTLLEAAIDAAMLEEAHSTVGGKDEAHEVRWDPAAGDLKTLVDEKIAEVAPRRGFGAGM